jgi:hypothetical protein
LALIGNSLYYIFQLLNILLWLVATTEMLLDFITFWREIDLLPIPDAKKEKSFLQVFFAKVESE